MNPLETTSTCISEVDKEMLKGIGVQIYQVMLAPTCENLAAILKAKEIDNSLTAEMVKLKDATRL